MEKNSSPEEYAIDMNRLAIPLFDVLEGFTGGTVEAVNQALPSALARASRAVVLSQVRVLGTWLHS